MRSEACDFRQDIRGRNRNENHQMDLSNPRTMAEFVISLKEELAHPISCEGARRIAEVMTETSFSEVPFLLWGLLSKHPRNLFVVHPHVGGILVDLATKKDPLVQAYMATHRNTVDAFKFPVYAELIHQGAIKFNPVRNRFDWT